MAIVRPEAIGAAPARGPEHRGGRRTDGFLASRGMAARPGEESCPAGVAASRSRRSRPSARSSHLKRPHGMGLGYPENLDQCDRLFRSWAVHLPTSLHPASRPVSGPSRKSPPRSHHVSTSALLRITAWAKLRPDGVILGRRRPSVSPPAFPILKAWASARRLQRGRRDFTAVPGSPPAPRPVRRAGRRRSCAPKRSQRQPHSRTSRTRSARWHWAPATRPAHARRRSPPTPPE